MAWHRDLNSFLVQDKNQLVYIANTMAVDVLGRKEPGHHKGGSRIWS